MDTPIGHITHYYDRISVAVLSLTETLELADKIRISGHTTDFEQRVMSLEIEHKKVFSGGPGEEVALKVIEPVRKGDKVYRVTNEMG